MAGQRQARYDRNRKIEPPPLFDPIENGERHRRKIEEWRQIQQVMTDSNRFH